MASIAVIDKKGKKVDTITLNEKVFDGKINQALLHQTITMYLANKRQGSAKVKMCSEVRGGGRKPWRQKGTGRARAGSIRSPLWRGGGVTFGPEPKDWHYQLPKKMKRLALLSSLNAKLKEESIVVIDSIGLESHKTKELTETLKKIKLSTVRLVIVASKSDDNIKRAASNIKKAQLIRVEDVNAYELLVNDKLLIEKSALEKIEKDLTAVVLKTIKTKRTTSAKKVT